MIVPAHAYLGESGTSEEALECLRRDLISGDTVCEQSHRLAVWQALLLTDHEAQFSPKTIINARDSAKAALAQYRNVKPDEEFDPLSNSETWNSYYQNEDLRTIILQDCERIFPEEPWFQRPQVQRLMHECLFTWCKSHADVSYKQGMHEIAGLVIWVVLHGSSEDESAVSEDSLTLFAAIMKHIKRYYEDTKNGSSAILTQASVIQNELLSQVDAVLSNRLSELGIEPQFYCLKWLRLVFIREFPLADVLKLWDTLFAADSTLGIINLVACAMLIRVRATCLEGDTNTVLSMLMKYPTQKLSPIHFVQDAVYLQAHLNSAGGGDIIDKYSDGEVRGKKELKLNLPTTTSTTAVPYTVSALLEQTDKLGINSYVWGAMEEVKRNVSPMISETRQALGRTALRDLHSPASTPSPTANLQQRDRELASMLALAISNLKNGDPLETNIARLEDIKFVLQGRKTLSEVKCKTPVRESPRPASAPHTSRAFSSTKRSISPIKIPAIKNKSSFTHESSARVLGNHDSNGYVENRDDIPLSTSPKRSSYKASSDFSFLFADDKPHNSAFNRSRKG